MLERSALLVPSEVRRALDSQNLDDGWHRVVYDERRMYVCSTPVAVEEVSISAVVDTARRRFSRAERPLGQTIRQVFSGLRDRRSVRREKRAPSGAHMEDRLFLRFDEHRQIVTDTARRNRLENFRSRARVEEDAFAAAVGIEVWSLGIQMVLAASD